MAETPPSAARDPALDARLAAAWQARGPDYRPRTHLLDGQGRARFVNRLILEASPYLIQHAHNPVDWHAWSPETLAEARARDLPIFLSVGYATCHWCHVMEDESFDNLEVAAVLNRHFVPVKLDREERPDLDQIYITATQLQQGHAGWPNSLFLMPDGRPFHTGTYFPRPQFLGVLRAVAEAWAGDRRAQVERVAAQLAEAVNRQGPGAGAGTAMAEIDPAVFGLVTGQLAGMFNEDEGGFSRSQQFPQEGFILYLIDHWRRTGDTLAWAMAARSLDALVAGGIHDHAGGGFHRYTVDPDWRTPHFEKMLYNQGQIARALVEGWEIAGHPAWRRAAERCFAYVMRDMTDADGAFHAAEDADSLDAGGRREEGAFYVWRPAEAAALMGADAAWAVPALGLDQPPTVEAGAVAHLDPAAAPDFDRLDPVLDRLRAGRETRPRPIRDDKVIAGWNGLMIRALAEAAEAFGRPDLAAAGARAGETLWARLWDGRRLARLWAEGRAIGAGTLEDYAWLGLGFLALADAGAGAVWGARAAALADAATTAFADPSGRLRMAEADGPFGPIFDAADGATPAGESAAAELFARLALRAPDPGIAARAGRLIGALAGPLAQVPLLRPDTLAAARILAEGESGARRTLAQGAIRARLGQGGRRLVLDIAPGWHVNAPDPGAGELTGATLDGGQADWPPAHDIAAGFADRPVRVLDGRVEVAIAPQADMLRLRLQPCSERHCLAPLDTSFRLHPDRGRGMLRP
ncbi:MAG: thioredoxin domain-containing protein [Thermohalobaculum sp.]|nr:thioredoxin domain-containing protein [Thermohalobaculum sp.]